MGASDTPLPGEPPLSAWADTLEVACAETTSLGLRQVRVLTTTGSTQDAAWEACAGRAGWLVVAGRQLAGRGRLGRRWIDTGLHSLAMTMTLPAERVSSVVAGLAVLRAAGRFVDGPRLGLRWPNDVVERERDGRKIAGVLIEVREGTALLGVGVNVGPASAPPGVSAVSMHELGAACHRLDVACALVRSLGEVLSMPAGEAVRAVGAHETLIGTARRFTHDGRVYEGVVESLDALGRITLRGADGGVTTLPASSTSLVHD